eukprot:m.232878 g.232878  ORF g.232878 m.232878 type:complete len:559 (-) comp18898_c0_seq1:37-1713(-)
MAAAALDIQALCTSLSAATLDESVTSTCQQIAELAKQEEVRTPLGEGGVLVKCCDVLCRASEAGERRTLVQAARAIGNMCFDHPENRKRVLASGAVSALAKVMLVPESVRGEEAAAQALAGAGVIINTSQDDEDIVSALVEAGAVENLLWLVEHAPSPRNLEFAIIALNRFQGNKEAVARLARTGGVRVLVGRACEVDEEQVDDLFHLVREVFDEDTLLPHLATDTTLDLLLTLRQSPGIPPKVAASAGLLLSAALSDDACLDHLLAAREGSEGLLEVCVSWLEHPTDEDLHVAGAISIGNMARSDARCSTLLSGPPRLIPALAGLVQRDITRVQHAALGALKNLSNYAPSKPLLTAALPLPAMLAALHAGTAHIQYQGATLLRALLYKQPAFVTTVVTFPGLLDRLVHLTGSEEERVRAESVRALANIARYGDAEAHVGLCQAGAVKSLVEMINSTHPLMRMEAASALAHACNVGSQVRAAALSSGVIEAVTQGLTNADNAPELLGTLVALAARLADPSLQTTESGAALIASVKALTKHVHLAVATQAISVVAAFKW